MAERNETLALLFTDIEGSTNLLRSLGADYRKLLAQHRRVLGDAFAAHGGTVLQREGDALFVTFADPSSAILGAIDGQVALAKARWPADSHVRVRMGIHVGEVTIDEDDDIGRHADRRRQLALRRRHPPRGRSRRRLPLSRRRHQRRRWGLEHGYCLMIGGEPMRSCSTSRRSSRARAGRRHERAHAGSEKARRHGGAGLAALRLARRRPLREDGAQRHRVRAHGRVRGGVERARARERRAGTSARSTPRRRRSAIPSSTSTISTSPRSPRSGGTAASSRRGCST